MQIVPRSEWTDNTYQIALRTKVQGIVLHHSASPNVVPLQGDAEKRRILKEVQSIYRYHTEHRGWKDIGYHFLISRGGVVVEARRGSAGILRDGKMPPGAHCPTKNATHVGICLEGNYQLGKDVPNSLWESLVRLMAYIASAAGFSLSRDVVLLHRDVVATQCPGDTIAEKLYAILEHAERVRARLSWR